MISISAYLVGLIFLIVLFSVGLYAVYKDNVMGFIASGFAAITAIVFTVLAGFGRVGDVEHLVVDTEIQSVTSLIDASIVYLNGFMAVMMVVILLFVIGRYIASMTLAQRGDEEE